MEMQNAQTVYLQTIKALLEESEIDKALQALRELDRQTQANIWEDVAQISGNYRLAAKSYRDNLIDFKEFSISSAKATKGLLDLMKELPDRLQTDSRVRALNTFQFELPDDSHLEKIIGPKSNLLRINWLEKALQAAKTVCRVVCADGSQGTGFLTREGYVFTNHHVLPDAETAKTARVEFNYEIDAAGKPKARTAYQLDAGDFKTNPTEQLLDFTRVRVIDRNDAPLNQWGYVEFDPQALPAVGESVTIIQHPNGEDKQIALNANEVLSIWDQYLFYTTDTEPGSSGSPVFNQDWRVVAIHHAGQTDHGGLQINARGDHRKANRGILFRDIFGFLEPPVDQPTVKTEATASQGVFTSPDAKPAGNEALKTAPSLPITPASTAIPKFVIVYDQADTPQCQLLNKYLNILKITKKVQVYNVHEALAQDLLAGAEAELANADYLLALVTVNLFNSPDWFGLILNALEQRRRVIPIRIEKIGYEGTGLERLLSLPTLNRAVSDFPNVDAAYADIVAELRKLIPK